MLEEKFMKLAIQKAKQGVRKGQTPFGACIVKKGKILACAHNTVWKSMDITSHAEIHAIRKACKRGKCVKLKGAVIYSTCEPCPMCFSASHWAGISKIVYGTSIRDAKKLGFSELFISNRQMKQLGKSHLKIKAGFLKEENRELFKFWKKQKGKRVY